MTPHRRQHHCEHRYTGNSVTPYDRTRSEHHPIHMSRCSSSHLMSRVLFVSARYDVCCRLCCARSATTAVPSTSFLHNNNNNAHNNTTTETQQRRSSVTHHHRWRVVSSVEGWSAFSKVLENETVPTTRRSFISY